METRVVFLVVLLIATSLTHQTIRSALRQLWTRMRPPPFEIATRDVQTNDTLVETLWASSEDIVLMFHAPWCVHCVQALPTVRAVAARVENLRTVDSDHVSDALLQRFGVGHFPFIVSKKKGVFDAQITVRALHDFVQTKEE